MNEIEEIRRLLASVEARLAADSDAEQRALRNLDALEFPELVATVIDFLQPVLEPYEAAIYWRLFRLSILGDGTQYARASTRGLQSGVIVSRSGQSSDLSYAAVQAALQGLESKGVITRVGETTREGTRYKLIFPRYFGNNGKERYLYRFMDRNVKSGTRYDYRLEVVSSDVPERTARQ